MYGGWHQKSCTRDWASWQAWRVQNFWCQPPYHLLTEVQATGEIYAYLLLSQLFYGFARYYSLAMSKLSKLSLRADSEYMDPPYIRRSWSGHRESNPHRELLFSRSNSASPKFRHASKSHHRKTFRLRRASSHTADDCRCVECHGWWCESAERSQTFSPERRFRDFTAGIG